MENNQLIKTEKTMEFVPVGAADKIKLSVEIVKNLLCKPTKKGIVCSPNDAIKFMMFCQAQRLNPFAGDAFLVGYDNSDGGAEFSLIPSHSALLKRAESNDEYDGMESGVIVQTEKGVEEKQGDFFMPGEVLLGGWAKVYHKKRSKPTYRAVRLERFKKNTKFWSDDPSGMIVKCAEADALRSTFATLCGGLYLAEEREMKIANAIEITPQALAETNVTMLPDAGDKHESPQPEPAKDSQLCKAMDMFGGKAK